MLIVEAARRSGTLITARMAAEQGREVFAVPGHPLDPRAEGTNRLLKTGATIATEPEDVIEALPPQLVAPVAGMSGTRGCTCRRRQPCRAGRTDAGDRRRRPGRLLAALGPAPIDIDALVRATGLSARAMQVALIELALAGRIERHGHGLVSLLSGGRAPFKEF